MTASQSPRQVRERPAETNRPNLQSSKDAHVSLVQTTGLGAVSSMTLLTMKSRGIGEGGGKEKKTRREQETQGPRTILRGVGYFSHRIAKTVSRKNHQAGGLSLSNIKTDYVATKIKTG